MWTDVKKTWLSKSLGVKVALFVLVAGTFLIKGLTMTPDQHSHLHTSGSRKSSKLLYSDSIIILSLCPLPFPPPYLRSVEGTSLLFRVLVVMRWPPGLCFSSWLFLLCFLENLEQKKISAFCFLSALSHHINDQALTVTFILTHLNGLLGMKWWGRMPWYWFFLNAEF